MGDSVSIALDELDVVGVHAETISHDHREGRLVALAMAE